MMTWIKTVGLFSLCLLFGGVAGLTINKVSTEVSLLVTIQQLVDQNQNLLTKLELRDKMLMGLEQESTLLKSSLDESVEIVTKMANEIELLHRDLDRMSYTLESKDRTIEELRATVETLRTLIEKKEDDVSNTNDSVTIEEDSDVPETID
jgi:predicted RNase H-like nuclease (RuvC/YqgF family)